MHCIFIPYFYYADTFAGSAAVVSDAYKLCTYFTGDGCVSAFGDYNSSALINYCFMLPFVPTSVPTHSPTPAPSATLSPGTTRYPTPTPTLFSTEEQSSLQAFYNYTAGSEWRQSFNWGGLERVSQWFGVQTREDGAVQSLALSGNALSGDLAAALSFLEFSSTNLKFLDLSNNALVGSIPETVTSFGSLSCLYLDRNYLSGTVPNNFGLLTQLEDLSLYENSLTGSIPTDFTSMKSLKTLNMHSNSLTGQIPNIFAGLQGLEYIFLSHNSFSGTLPSSMAGLQSLRGLAIQHNELEGPIADEFAALRNLSIMLLHANKYNGTLFQYPLTVNVSDPFPSLQYLYAHINKFEGEISPVFGSLTSLYDINLGENLFSGALLIF